MVSELAVPTFIDRSPEIVETEVISLWETLADKTLYPGQAERLLINLLTYRETLLRVGIQYAAEQNLVNLANGVNLDQLGALVGAPRLAESFAQTTLRFTLAASRAVDTLIPAGTRARVPGATVLFQTDENATITAGNFTVDVVATAGTAGVVGNDYTAGQITQLLDPLPGLTLTVSNTTTSSGGADTEADDPYRERIKLAPSQFSVAGPADAYKFHTLSVSQTIIDASVVMPLNAAGGKLRIYVDVYPLTSTGLPSAELITAVQTALDNNQIRPLCDIVTVKTPTSVGFAINADITLLDEADAALMATQIDAAVTAYVADRESELGQDIIVSQIVGVITGVPGVYNVTLYSPTSDIVVTETEWANHTNPPLYLNGRWQLNGEEQLTGLYHIDTPVLNIVGTNEG